MFDPDSPCLLTTADSFFTDVLSASVPVLVDFWAPWCTPCRIVAPVMEELAIELSDRLIVATVNTDENGDLARGYGVGSIPTFALFVNGALMRVWIGARPKASLRAELISALDEYLN